MRRSHESRNIGTSSRRGILGAVCLREVGAIVLLIGGSIWGLTQLGVVTSSLAPEKTDEDVASIHRMAVSSSGGELWLTRKGHGLFRHSLLDDSEVQVLPRQYPLIEVAVFADDRATVWAISRTDGRFEIWWNGRVVLEYQAEDQSDFVRSATFADRGRLLVTACLNGRLLVWRREGSTYVFDSDRQVAEYLDLVRVSADGRFAACVSLNQQILIWDLQNYRLLSTWKLPHETCSALQWSPDGQTLATAGAWGRLCLWDAATAELKWDIRADLLDPLDVVFTPAGDRLITGGFDGRVRVWGAAKGVMLAEHEGHKDIVRILAVPTSGDRVYSGGYDGRVLSWPL